MKTPVGFVGIGLMGSAMAQRLLKSGYTLNVYTRTKQKGEGVLSAGAKWFESPADVAKNSDIVLSMISDSKALEEIAQCANGILHGLKKGGVHVDMSTVAPATTESLAAKYESSGCHFIHSPVLGSVPNATDGSLLLFVGGTDEAFAKVEPVLKSLGSHLWRFEKPEMASNMKLVCNSFIAGMILTLTQGIVYAKKAQINPATLLEILSHSALNSTMYQTKGKAIIDRNFTPRFFVEHMLKDIELALEAAGKIGVPMPGLEAAQKLFQQATVDGYTKEDYSAVMKVLEQQAA